MNYIVICSMCFVFSLVVAILYKSGKNTDRRKRRLDKISGKVKIEIDEELSVPFVKRFVTPALRGMVSTFTRLMPKKEKAQSSARLGKKLALAGLRVRPSEYLAGRIGFMFAVLSITIVIILLGAMDAMLRMLLLMGGLLVSLLVPSLYLSLRIKSRQLSIRNQLPDVLDLMSVCVEAGLSFDGALLYIEQYSYGPLVDELTTVKKEIQMGLNRRDALKNLTERTDVPELKTFVGALIQSDQIGLPLRNVMSTQASQLRLTRKQTAEEKAMKAPVKMMLPLIVFVLPVTLIILMGPAILNIIDALGS